MVLFFPGYLLPRRVLADSRETGIIRYHASTLNVLMVHSAILLDGSCSCVFRFPHLRRLGTRQLPGCSCIYFHYKKYTTVIRPNHARNLLSRSKPQ